MSTPYDYITINTPSGGISTTYTGTEINFNTPAISDVTKAEVALKAKQTLNGYSYPWSGGGGKNKLVHVYGNGKRRTLFNVESCGGIRHLLFESWHVYFKRLSEWWRLYKV